MTKRAAVCGYDERFRCSAKTCTMADCPDAEGVQRGVEFVVVDLTIETEVRI